VYYQNLSSIIKFFFFIRSSLFPSFYGLIFLFFLVFLYFKLQVLCFFFSGGGWVKVSVFFSVLVMIIRLLVYHKKRTNHVFSLMFFFPSFLLFNMFSLLQRCLSFSFGVVFTESKPCVRMMKWTCIYGLDFFIYM